MDFMTRLGVYVVIKTSARSAIDFFFHGCTKKTFTSTTSTTSIIL